MKFDGLTFDEAMEQLERRIEKLEKDNGANNQELYEEAIALKEYCSDLLKKEKEEIVKIAKENNIALSDIGLSQEDEVLDYDDEDYDEGEATTSSEDKVVR